MDLSVIFQLRTKKFWWMDVIFYFVISSLVATVFCYFIFMFKNEMIRKQISDEMATLQTVGTKQQKQNEAEVMVYKKKINDFTVLLKNHEFASNAFAFIQAQTLPNIWFSQFSLDEKNREIQLSGEADSLDAFSRQVALLENDKRVTSVETFNSSLGTSARITFGMNIILDSSVFGYLSNISPAVVPVTTTTPPATSATPPTTTTTLTTTTTTPATTTTVTTTTAPSTGTKTAVTPPAKGEKLITSFHLLAPDVAGVIDLAKYTITVTVPFGTGVKNLTPIIVSSPGTVVTPGTLVSQDFTSPITYNVVTADGSSQNYQVKVIVAPEVPAAPVTEQPNQSGSSILIFATAGIVGLIIVIVGIFIFIKRGRKGKDMSKTIKT